MKECTNIYELLSAYFDGELTESEKRIVEEHIASCDECSAILEIYSEISNTTSASNVAVPEGLHIGVMNRIQHESIAANLVAPMVNDKEIKRLRFNTMLTRWVPVAACLAVVLAGWQLWSNWGNIFSADFAASAPEAEMAFADAAPEVATAADAGGYLWDAVAEEEADFFDDEDDSHRLRSEVGIYAAFDEFADEYAEVTQDAYDIESMHTFRAEVLVPDYGYGHVDFDAWLLVYSTTLVFRNAAAGTDYVIIAIAHDQVDILDADGNPISYADIQPGTTIEVTFYGELTLTEDTPVIIPMRIQVIE